MTPISLFLAAALIMTPSQAEPQHPRVAIEQGGLIGRTGGGVGSFKGVP